MVTIDELYFFEKILLVHRRHVTGLITVCAGEPIRVQKLEQVGNRNSCSNGSRKLSRSKCSIAIGQTGGYGRKRGWRVLARSSVDHLAKPLGMITEKWPLHSFR